MLNNKQIARIRADIRSANNRYPLVFQALGDPTRFKIFRLVMKYHDICVTDIAKIFGITVPAASQQLRTLERLELVYKIKMGQMVCHEINRANPIARKLLVLLSAENKSASSGKKKKK